MSRELILSSRKVTVPSVSSSSVDDLPDPSVLEVLKECCPDAAFFTIIPKLDVDDLDTAYENDSTIVISLLTSIGDGVTEGTKTLIEVLEMCKNSCTTSAICELVVFMRMQSSSTS